MNVGSTSDSSSYLLTLYQKTLNTSTSSTSSSLTSVLTSALTADTAEISTEAYSLLAVDDADADTETDTDEIDAIMSQLQNEETTTSEFVSTLIDLLNNIDDDPLKSLYEGLKNRAIPTDEELSKILENTSTSA